MLLALAMFFFAAADGVKLYQQRQFAAATEELQAELARSPHHGMANQRLGQVFLASNQAAQAVPFLEQAVDAMSESTDARKQWEAVAKARPDDDQVHYLLGNLYRQLGDADRARRELQRHREILERRQK